MMASAPDELQTLLHKNREQNSFVKTKEKGKKIREFLLVQS
jgi:hypothetical protein